MISFSLSDEQKQFQALARQFTKDVIIPQAAEFDQAEEYPVEIVKQAYELGLLNTIIPQSVGGLGLGMMDEVIIGEEIGYGCMGIYTILMASELGITPLLIAANEEQKKRFLAPLLEGPKLAAFALSEADNGSDAAGLGTKAEFDGDDVILNGNKMWISNGGLADITVVFANHAPEKKHKGVMAIVVEKDTPGFSYQKIHGKMGQRATYTAELILDNVRVPKENILGEIDQGFKIAMNTLNKTRIPVAAGSVGIARRALDESITYAQERIAFGRPINRFQAIQMKLADMKIGIESARLATYYAAYLVDENLPHISAAAVAKTLASDVAVSAANEAIQIHGGFGYINEYPVEKLLRDAKLNQIYEGTNEIQRLVIARELNR